MMKIYNFLKNNTKWLMFIFVLLFTAGSLAWVGYDTVRNSVGLGHREIVNDDYSVLTRPIADEQGIKQKIYVGKNTDFYGVNLNIHTYNRVCHGTLYVDLLDESGNVVGSDSCDLTRVLDNTFRRFIFGGGNFRSRQDEEYYIHMYISPQTAEDKVALWKSRRTVEDMTIEENGLRSEGTAAVQYITKYADERVISRFVMLRAVFMTAAAAVYFGAFIKKIKIENLFLTAAALVGLAFALLIPINGAPDEYVHISTAYKYSNSILGVENARKRGQLTVRSQDASNSYDSPVNYNVFELIQANENAAEGGEGDEFVTVEARINESAFFPVYLPQTAALTLSRILGLSYGTMMTLGRLANLAAYIVLVYFALKIIPSFKGALAVVALSPLPMELAASFCYDSVLIGLCFLFAAYAVNLAYNKSSVTVKDVAALAVMAALIAPAKTVYLPFVGLILLIPINKYKNKKTAYISIGSVFALSLIMWGAVNFTSVSYILGANNPYDSSSQSRTAALRQTAADSEVSVRKVRPDKTETQTETETQPAENRRAEADMYKAQNANGDSPYYFSPGFILRNIPMTIKLVINTIQENSIYYLQQILGGKLGEVIVSPLTLRWQYPIMILIIWIMAMIPADGKVLLPKLKDRFLAFVFAALPCLLAFAGSITWTPINYTTVFGMQGRYIYPVLPVILMCMQSKNLSAEKNRDSRLVFAVVMVNVFAMINAFVIMAMNTTVHF